MSEFIKIFLMLFAFSLAADDKVSFSFEVRPILSDKCFFCHGPDNENREAKLRLDTAEGAYKALKNGKHPIKPGSAKESLIWERIITDDEDDLMPPPDSNLKLTDKEKEIIKKWINQGAEYTKHWAFEKLPPKIAVPAKTENPIDAFIDEKLKQAGLKPSKEADKTILLRRAKMAITGLPPTVDEINAFLNDKSPTAYEKAVNTFLKSPATAERLAVDWMDLSRFADTYGFQVDRSRDMTPWRDWVLKAFNENMPYDQFITWQLAGDLIENPTRDSMIATAFNRHHQQKVEGGTIEEEFRVEYVADRTHTAGTAFLGLTFECARCHDHKYDPISAKDYYSLFAFFNSIDESGLYSYFTSSVPTPTFPLTDANKEKQLADLKKKIQNSEKALKQLEQSEKAAFNSWLKSKPDSTISGMVGSFTFDDHKDGLKNKVKGQPNAGGRPTIIDGATGNAFLLTGDNALNFNKLGPLDRASPISISIDLKVPQKMQRAVVVHRSKAWTDAASRGYELLIEDGKMTWAFIHFWPGNAMRIGMKEELPVGKWIKLTATYDGSSKASGLKLYLNGKAVETEVIRDNLTKEIHYGGKGNKTNLAIGARMRDRGFTKGGVDNFMVFNRELSSLEVADLAKPDTIKKSLTQGLSSGIYSYYLNNHSDKYKKALTELMKNRQAYNGNFDKVREIMVMKELPQPRDTYVLKRGLYNMPDMKQKVQPSAPEAVMAFDKSLPRNRLGLAKWLTDPSHPLTARVTVNRYWKMIFGKGIVTTPDDFGSQGALPSHPELLNWLARDFISNGWNVKDLLKKMVMSKAFRQSSVTNQEMLTKDPFNKWLSFGPRRRLSAEMIRDQALVVGNLLNNRFGGNSENAKSSMRRGLYLFWKRNDPPPSMLIFDAPRRQVCSVKRESTSTPLQALVLLNKDMYVKSSKALADVSLSKHKGDKNKTLNHIFMSLTGRKASTAENQILLSILDEQMKYFADKKKTDEFLKANSPRITWKNRHELAAWSVVAATVMNLDASITLR